MKSVLVDTGPLVALFDPRDGLHKRARRELDAIRGELFVEVPVLTEAHFHLQSAAKRSALAQALERGLFSVKASIPSALLRYAFRWLGEYAEHKPDFADAWLIAAADQNDAAVWTFDSEFKTVWRTLDGRRVTLVP